jgi:nucleotide-binding universal stress UspA family protein
MFRTIILALDGSEGADRAVPVAAGLAKRNGAHLIVAHARTHARETELDAHLDRQIEQLHQQGIDAEVVKQVEISGREADMIARVADDRNADLIVIAGRGRSPFAGALLGSVTHRLLHIAGCPTLVIPPGESPLQPRQDSPEGATRSST